MRYSIEQIIAAITVVMISILFIDSYQNIDKVKRYCCCNLDKIEDVWMSSNFINDTLVSNSFCYYGNYDYYTLGLIGRVKLVLSKFNNNTLAIRINSFLTNNYFCKYIKENIKEIPNSFWDNNCYSFIA